MSAPECPAVSWYEGLPCGLPEGHADYHEARGGGIVWGTRPPAREGRRPVTRPLVPGYLRRAVVRLVDAVCAPLDRALCRWTNETGDDA